MQFRLAIIIVVLITACTSTTPSYQNLLVGTYTDTESKGIYRLSFDATSGGLMQPELVAEVSNPSYLAIDSKNKIVYTVCEKESGKICSYSWTDENKLEILSSQATQGNNPCYIDYSEKNQMIASANYSTGDVSIRPAKEGVIGDTSYYFKHLGSGPNETRQEGPHAHFAKFSPNGNYIYVIDLGIDQVLAYPINDGRVDSSVVALDLMPGDGPRHLTFHPTLPFAFIVNELSSTVVGVRMDEKSGVFTEVSRISTLPDDYVGHNQCADIHITSDGKFLYASNRGHNSIAMYSVGNGGELESLGTVGVEGDWPRNFTLSPDERFLLVANRHSNNITVFERNGENGIITYSGNQVSLPKPVCLKFY